MLGAQELLDQITADQLTRVVVTGSGQASLLDRLTRHYPGVFAPERIVSSMDVKHGKPDPEPYLMGLEKAGVQPWEAIVGGKRTSRCARWGGSWHFHHCSQYGSTARKRALRRRGSSPLSLYAGSGRSMVTTAPALRTCATRLNSGTNQPALSFPLLLAPMTMIHTIAIPF